MCVPVLVPEIKPALDNFLSGKHQGEYASCRARQLTLPFLLWLFIAIGKRKWIRERRGKIDEAILERWDDVSLIKSDDLEESSQTGRDDWALSAAVNDDVSDPAHVSEKKINRCCPGTFLFSFISRLSFIKSTQQLIGLPKKKFSLPLSLQFLCKAQFTPKHRIQIIWST